MENGYIRFENDLKEVEEHFPKFKIVDQAAKKFLRGTFQVIDDDGKLWESYEIEIRYGNGFPYRFPELREIGQKIPKIADWHIYEDTGNCCITVPAQEILFCRNGITVKHFIEHHVRPYLFNQAHRKHFGVYANGEYEHGVVGKWQNYFEIFGTENKRKVIQWIRAFLNNGDKIHKKSKCICGSGNRFRRCHKEAYWLLRKSTRDFLTHELKGLEVAISLPIPRVKTSN